MENLFSKDRGEGSFQSLPRPKQVRFYGVFFGLHDSCDIGDTLLFAVKQYHGHGPQLGQPAHGLPNDSLGFSALDGRRRPIPTVISNLPIRLGLKLPAPAILPQKIDCLPVCYTPQPRAQLGPAAIAAQSFIGGQERLAGHVVNFVLGQPQLSAAQKNRFFILINEHSKRLMIAAPQELQPIVLLLTFPCRFCQPKSPFFLH
jgi:hypothetical protein